MTNKRSYPAIVHITQTTEITLREESLKCFNNIIFSSLFFKYKRKFKVTVKSQTLVPASWGFNVSSTLTINNASYSLCYSFLLWKNESTNSSYFPGLSGELNDITHVKHLEHCVRWPSLKGSISISRYYYYIGQPPFPSASQRAPAPQRRPIPFSPHLATSTTDTVFCFFNLCFGRPTGLA